MSDENEIPIDDPIDGLSHEGRTIEAMLEAAELPASHVNRDVLMYQAGWQAALADASEPLNVATPRTSLFLPAMTTAFAVASAVLGMMLFFNGEPALEVAAGSASETSQTMAIVASVDEGTEAIVTPAEPVQLSKARNSTSLFGLFGFPQKSTYRQRIENYSRESQWQIAPAQFEYSDYEPDTARLKTGSFLNAEELIDDLL